MNGCKYCRVEPNGDIPYDRESIWVRKFMSLMGIDFDLQIWFTTKNNLAIDLENDRYPFEKGAVVKINYCPMCGRKLGGDTE